MKTVHLNKDSPSVSELLNMARKKSVLLVSSDGASFVLEEADDFDREVAELGNSARFMRFLKKRSKEEGVTSIEQFAGGITEKRQKVAVQRTHELAKPLCAPTARRKRSSQCG